MCVSKCIYIALINLSRIEINTVITCELIVYGFVKLKTEALHVNHNYLKPFLNMSPTMVRLIGVQK